MDKYMTFEDHPILTLYSILALYPVVACFVIYDICKTILCKE